jgi:hypothetical protein
MTLLIRFFAILGFLLSIVIVTGIVLDFRDFDRTKGGYEPPYEGVVGEPINWDRMDLTSTGLVKRGYIINVHLHGTTGMLSFEIFKMKWDFRVVSGRAIAVHKPREALIRRGFSPEF